MTAARTSSMQRFKQLSEELQLEIRRDAIAELQASADQLVQQMKSAAPVGATGNLRTSIRKEPGKNETTVRVMAGGVLTTVQGRKYNYDYAMAVEFGTQQAGAHPFFYPSWRLRRKRIRSAMKRRITANIKKRSAE